ncbi:eukaryotic rRNA processing [Spinellus fusiger]|nr:eukaryotic rRNA processing [Spinellus fusiger]
MSSYAEQLLANALLSGQSSEDKSETEDTHVSEEEEDIEFPFGISLEDLDESDINDDDGDLIVEQHITVNNEAALKRIKGNLEQNDMPFSETLVVTSQASLVLHDIHDDLAREQAFHDQALEAVKTGMKVYAEAGMTFLCPATFHAPMLKSNALTLKINKQTLEKAASRKDTLDPKAQRELEMLSKKVQLEQKHLVNKHANAMENQKLLKRKRKDISADDIILDDVETEEADRKEKRKEKHRGKAAPLKKKKGVYRPGKSKRQSARRG